MPLWLNPRGAATEVPCRAGHGVAVLLKIYACCVDSQTDTANKRTTGAFAPEHPARAR